MIRRGWLVVGLLAMPGCGLTGFEDGNRLDPEEIQSLIDSAPYPEITPRSTSIKPERITVKPDGTRSVEINLVEALRLSLANNQNFLTSSESLDIQLLSLEVLRRSWWPLLSPLAGTVSWVDAKDADPASAQSLSATLSQKLPLGGTASLGFSEAGAQGFGPNIYSSAVTAGVNIPLFRGGGWRLTVESKVAAERGYAYALRTYEYARTELLIQTVQSYFGILQQEVTMANLLRNLESTKRGVELATLQFGRGKVTRTDVFRAELAVSSAESQLTNSREQMRLTLDSFKIDLGLRPEDELILEREEFDFKTLVIEAAEALEAAFATNPRWLNARDQFDDAGRALEIASNAKLPQIDLSATYSWIQLAETRPFEEFHTGSRAVALGGSFSLDLDRSTVNRDYQEAVIRYRQAERSFQRARDEIARETQRLVIQVRQSETSMKIQDRARKEAEKALELIEDEYDRGMVNNFEVIQAREQLVAAKNNYEAELVSAKVSQLRLLQWIGRLQPDDEGRWVR